METNLPEIAKAIFTGAARPDWTYGLGLEDCTPPDAGSAERGRTLFEIVLIMFFEGIKVRFGDDACAEKLTEQQLASLIPYMRSFGFTINVISNPLQTPPPVPDHSPSDITDFCERFYDADRGLWHQISFDWIPMPQLPMPNAGHEMHSRNV